MAGDDHDHAHELPDTLDAATTDERARNSAVVAWWQLTTFIEVAGPDAVTLLDAVVSQDIAGIEPGSGRFALLLTNKARIVAPVIAWRVDDERVLLELDPELVEVVHAHLKRYRLRAKATLTPLDLATVSLVGPAATAAPEAAGPGWHDSPAWGVPARTFIGAHDEAHALVDDVLPSSGFELADPETLDALRIEHATPALNDLLVGAMPAEVGGVEVGVSLTKGCYLGQEPVARLHYRGRANRTLRRVRLAAEVPHDYFEGRDPADEGYLALVRTEGADDDRPVGTLTSWASTPAGDLVGLAVLRREIEADTTVRLAHTDVAVTALDAPPATVERATPTGT